MCQRPPTAAKATRKVRDHGQETTGNHHRRPQDHSVPETAGCSKGKRQGVPEGSFCGISFSQVRTPIADTFWEMKLSRYARIKLKPSSSQTARSS